MWKLHGGVGGIQAIYIQTIEKQLKNKERYVFYVQQIWILDFKTTDG